MMINSVNQSPTFGRRCAIVLPACTDVSKLLERIKGAKKNPNLYIKFVEGKNPEKLAWDEFTYVGMEKIKGTEMAQFIFDDGRKYTSFQLPAFLKYIIGNENRIVNL